MFQLPKTLLSLASLLLAGASPAPAPRPLQDAGTTTSVTIERQLGLMGTSLVVSIEHTDRRSALLASEAAIVELERVEARLSTWRESSELSELNRAPVGERTSISPELHGELSRARELRELTDGAFDPAVGALLQAWKVREGGRVPSERERAAAVVAGGLEALRLSPPATGSFWAERLSPNLRLEEGGFGKGAGLDRALTVLREHGALSVRLDLGGQLLLEGRRETHALADPCDRSRAVLSLSLESGSLATSGNSERGFELDGKRRAHLFHPQTGVPVADFGSLTVVARDAFTADALSTGLYVLGPERALQLAAQLEDVELILLDTRHSPVRATLTSGLRGRVTLLDPALEIVWVPSAPSAAPRTAQPLSPSQSALSTSP